MKMEEAKENRSMWLMKCPSLAASSSLKSLPFPDDPHLPVAKVIISIDPHASVDDDTKVVMELASAEFGNIPKRYALDIYKDVIPMSVLCESSSHGVMSVQGKIKNVCDMRLRNENTESYGQLCRERANKYMCKNKQIQEKKKVTLEIKRTRREMEEVMFTLFERQSHWTLTNLIQDTDQPEQFLKDLLRDLCIYNNEGSNQGTYELKAEYNKKVSQE